jgi:hypothetical protein
MTWSVLAPLFSKLSNSARKTLGSTTTPGPMIQVPA